MKLSDVPKPGKTTINRLKKWARIRAKYEKRDSEKVYRELKKKYAKFYVKVCKMHPKWSNNDKIEGKARAFMYIDEKKVSRQSSTNFIGTIVQKQKPINWVQRYWDLAEFLLDNDAPKEKYLTKKQVMKAVNNIEDKDERKEMIWKAQGVKHLNEQYFQINQKGEPIDLRVFSGGKNKGYGKPYPESRYIRGLNFVCREVNKERFVRMRMTVSDSFADPEDDKFVDPEILKPIKFSAIKKGKNELGFSTQTNFSEIEGDVADMMTNDVVTPLENLKNWIDNSERFDFVITKGLLIQLWLDGENPNAVIGDPDMNVAENNPNIDGFTVWLNDVDVEIPEAAETYAVGRASVSTKEGSEGRISINGDVFSFEEVVDTKEFEDFDIEEEEEEASEEDSGDEFWDEIGD